MDLSKSPLLLSLALLLLIAAWLAAPAGAEARVPDVSYLMSKTSEDLLQEADDMVAADTLLENAEESMKIVVDRYYNTPSDPAARRNATVALMRLGNLYQTRRHNYRQAYHDLILARTIAEEDRNDYQLALICISLSNLYLFNWGGNQGLRDEAMRYMVKAFDYAMAGKNEKALSTSVADMTIIGLATMNFDPFIPSLKRFLALSAHPDSPEMPVVIEMAKATVLYDEGKKPEAIRALKRARELVKDHNFKYYKEALPYSIDNCLVYAYIDTEDAEDGITLARLNYEKACRDNDPSRRLTFCQKLGVLYKMAQMPDSADKYYSESLRLEASYRTQIGYESVGTLDLQSKIDRLNEQVDTLSKDRLFDNRAVKILIFVIAIGGVAAFLLGIFNRRRKNSIKETASPTPASPTPPTTPQSEVSDEDRKALTRVYNRVLAVMSESDDICQPGFGIHDLSKLVNVPTRTLSKAINLCHDSNFHQLLGEQRVRRVVKMMSDADSQNLTIQAISESAGFRSRTNFTSIFKKNMGMTPSEYWAQLHPASDSE